MKKVLIVLALVALAIVPVAAKGVGAIGLELGSPSGVTFNYDINDKWDGYATIGFGFIGDQTVRFAVGGQYKVAEFNIEKAEFDVNVGLQSGATIYLGDNVYFGVPILATGAVSYDWTWKDVGDFTAYIRLGLGIGLVFGDSVGAGFDGAGALGCVYHF